MTDEDTTEELVQGDTRPFYDFHVTIEETGADVNLTGCTVNFYFRKKKSPVLVNTGHTLCTITDYPGGWARYQWGANDLKDAGDYEAEAEVTYGDATKATYPRDTPWTFKVRGQIG